MTLNNNNNYQYPNLPVSIIWPQNPNDVPWFMERLYEQLVFAINQKDNGIFQMAISNTPTQIPNLDNTGSYIVNISGAGPYIDPATGELNYWPAIVYLFTKSTPNTAGLWQEAQTQDGSGSILGISGTAVPPPVAYKITSSRVPATTGPYYYFIQHNVPGITGSFNVNIQGTKL